VIKQTNETKRRGCTRCFSVSTNKYLTLLLTSLGGCSWKIRKAAIEKVQSALSSCNNLISYHVDLVDLVKALNERIGDSQSNLKPLSAEVVGQVINGVEAENQPRLAKIVATSLMGSIASESKKNMRVSALKGIRLAVSGGELEGNKVNKMSIEAIVPAFISVLTKMAGKGNGLHELLNFFTTNSPHLSNLFCNEFGDAVGAKSSMAKHCNAFVSCLLKCMTSAISDIRNESEKLFKSSLQNVVFMKDSVEKNVNKLSPADQRTVKIVVGRVYETLAKEEGDNVVIKEVVGVVEVEPVMVPERVLVVEESGGDGGMTATASKPSAIMGGAKRKASKDKIVAPPKAQVELAGGSVSLSAHPLNNSSCEYVGRASERTKEARSEAASDMLR